MRRAFPSRNRVTKEGGPFYFILFRDREKKIYFSLSILPFFPHLWMRKDHSHSLPMYCEALLF